MSVPTERSGGWPYHLWLEDIRSSTAVPVRIAARAGDDRGAGKNTRVLPANRRRREPRCPGVRPARNRRCDERILVVRATIRRAESSQHAVRHGEKRDLVHRFGSAGKISAVYRDD